MDKKYRTRDGRNVRILATDLKDSECPVVVAIEQGERETVLSLTADGRRFFRIDSDRDLIEVKPRIQRTVWINLYNLYTGGAYPTRAMADAEAMGGRLACVEVNIDCEEGEGL
jgi:hypothetical protein